jgi:hypothetical protein
MTASRPTVIAVASAALVVGLVAGCSARTPAESLAPSHPGSSQATTDSKAIPQVQAAKKYQLGLDMDFYTYPGQDVTEYAETDIQYVKSLHANALSVAFPFFTNGPKSSSVHASPETPSPAELELLAKDAKKAGLYFSLRPLLDDAALNQGKLSRTSWLPPHLKAWFTSYEKFLKPYATMAQAAKIPEFVIGVEFDEFNSSPYWAKLAAYLRHYYHGTLAYSNNWNVPIASRVNSAGVVQTDDAYPIIHKADNASVASLTKAWDAYLRTRPAGIALSEVGIAAQSHAYAEPYNVKSNGKPLIPAIQAHWFDAVCKAVVNEREAGVYFWAFSFGQPLNVPPSTSSPASYVDGAGQKAISSCFKRLS